MNRWEIGSVKITRIVELETLSKGTFVLPDATPENVKRDSTLLMPHFADANGKMRMSVHALVVESQGRRIVVDTCIGNDKRRPSPAWNMLHTSFLMDLEQAGFPRDSIDYVLCTHLHVDHVGWNTMLVGDRWIPTFPHARYLIGRKEWEHWSADQTKFVKDPIDDSVRPVIDAGLAEFVEPDHKLTDGVWLESAPGHTPGHFSVRISSSGKEAVITGDLMHHPIQFLHPEWNCGADSIPEVARATRRAFIERYADKSVLVFGTHFATPSAGYITRHGNAWLLRVEG
ncbi:MAG TPA: MBL fold metallo-hydrolase [Candidatus Binataceae bacterium]|nr:MBL fold metallo-hydrolase [Candidatus Binataceae bacterium]